MKRNKKASVTINRSCDNEDEIEEVITLEPKAISLHNYSKGFAQPIS